MQEAGAHPLPTNEAQLRPLTSLGEASEQARAWEAAIEGVCGRAEAVTMMPHKGPHYFEINTALQDAITRVDVDGTDDPDSSWAKFADAVESLG